MIEKQPLRANRFYGPLGARVATFCHRARVCVYTWDTVIVGAEVLCIFDLIIHLPQRPYAKQEFLVQINGKTNRLRFARGGGNAPVHLRVI